MPEINKEQVVEYLSKMPVIELAGLIKDLEEKWGVSSALPLPQAVGAPTAEAAAPEKTEFDVTLLSVGANKIAVIKEVRSITGLGLKEAKELVESARKPIKKALPSAEAEKIKAALEKSGAKVEIK